VNRVRKKLALTLAVGITLVLSVAVTAIAYEAPYVSACLQSASREASECQGFPGLVADFGARVVPKKLPKREMAPVAVILWGKISTSGGGHPPALREATIDFDRNIVVNATGLPACRTGGREWDAGNLAQTCKDTIVGKGRMDFQIALPDDAQTSALIPLSSNLTVYNGGRVAGVATLYAVTSVSVPVPRAIVIPIGITRIGNGRYGLRAVAKVPVIAGGHGSLRHFKLRIERAFSYKGSEASYAMARCPDRRLGAKISALFKNDANEPGVAPATLIGGTVVSHCTPTR
jgi:hypothetical protein